MQIDLITVTAQLINFLILVWLLNRFLFRPVLDVMSSRESLIDEQLNEASVRKQQSDVVIKEHQNAISSLESDKKSILDAESAKAEAQAKMLLDDARADVDERRQVWLDSLAVEKRELADSFKASVASTTRYVSDALLRKISNRGLDQQMIDSFIEQLATLDSANLNKLDGKPAVISIVSAMPMDSAARRSLTRAVHAQLRIDSVIDYQVDQRLIAGLHLIANGVDIDWHISDMLEQLDDELSRVVENIGASNH